jgi:hypothetical protein
MIRPIDDGSVTNRKTERIDMQDREIYKSLSKNSTARILLSKAKITKMQKHFPQKLIPKMAEIPETTKKQRSNFPSLPQLSHRRSTGTLLPLSWANPK